MKNNFEVLTSTEYEKSKNNAINAQPVQKKIKISEIEIKNESFIQYKGINLKLEDSAKKDLFQLLGLNNRMLKHIESYSSKQQTIRFIDWFRRAAANNSKMDLEMIINPNKKHVIAFRKSKSNLISNQTFLNLAEKIIDNNNLDINNMSVDEFGNMNINALKPENYWSVNGIRDEDFVSGISISNSIDNGTQLASYLGRIICTNGMISYEIEEKCQMRQLDNNSYNKFKDAIESLERRNFKPKSFDNHVYKAISTRASVNEILKTNSLMLKNSELDKYSVNEYLSISDTADAYKPMEINIHKLGLNEKKNAASHLSVWELINIVTDFASHDKRVSESNGHKLQNKAGELFYSNYDMSNTIPVRDPFPKINV